MLGVVFMGICVVFLLVGEWLFFFDGEIIVVLDFWLVLLVGWNWDFEVFFLFFLL